MNTIELVRELRAQVNAVWNRLHELEKHLSQSAPQPILLPTGNTAPKAAHLHKPVKSSGKTFKRNATFDRMPRPGERFAWEGKEYQIKAVTDDMLTAAVLENGIPKVGRPSEFGILLSTPVEVEAVEPVEGAEVEVEVGETDEEIETDEESEEVDEETEEVDEEDVDTFQPTDEEREERYANLAWGADSEDDEFSEVDADADVDIDETYEDD